MPIHRISHKLAVALLVAIAGTVLFVVTRTNTVRKNDNIGANGERLYQFQPIEAEDRADIHYLLEAKDEGIVYTHGNGPNDCDSYGARDVWVWEYQGIYYMHYDGAGKNGWLTCLATSKDLVHWNPLGAQLQVGRRGQKDAGSASYGITYFHPPNWYMYYLGASNVSDSINRVPTFPYVIMKATAKNPDGPWKKEPGFTFCPLPGTYYSETASPGHIIEDGNRRLMFFSASTKKSPTKTLVARDKKGQLREVTLTENREITFRSIGIARSSTLDAKWVPDRDPILPATEQIENSSLYYQESNHTWFLFTNHVGMHVEAEYTDAVWVYWTDNLEKWNPANKAVVLDGMNCRWSKKIIGLPSVVKVGNRLAVLYDGFAGDFIPSGSDVHMRREIGLAWLDLPLTVRAK